MGRLYIGRYIQHAAVTVTYTDGQGRINHSGGPIPT